MPIGRVGMDGGMVTTTPVTGIWRQSGALLRATFTAANGTRLNAYQPEVGPLATELQGVWQVTGNAAAYVSGGSPAAVIWALGQADVAVGATIVTDPTSPNPGLLVRSTGVAAAGYFVFAAGGASNWAIFEYNGGSFTNRASGGTMLTSTSYRAVFAAVGGVVTGYVDGVQVCTYASASRNQATGTNHGTRCFNDTGSRFDDLVAWTATAVTIPTGVV